MNYLKIDNGVIDSDLEIPQISEYSFDIDVRETVFQTVTYRHTTSSYSEKNAVPISQRAEYDGNFSVYDGDSIHTEIYDAETNDITWDYKSVTKLKSK